MDVNKAIQEYSSTNHKNLKLLRDAPEYDILETWLHQTTMLIMVSKLKVKVSEVVKNNPEADVSEQMKMIADLGETVWWMDGMQKQFTHYRAAYYDTKQALNGLGALNQMQEKKIEEQEARIKQLESQLSF